MERGEPPIDGFTSLLQVLLYAAGIGLGADAEALSQVMGVTFAAATCVAGAWLAAEVAGTARAAVLAAFLLALTPSLAFWARGGLETTCFTFLLSLAMAAWLRDRRHSEEPRVERGAVPAGHAVAARSVGIAVVTVVFDCVGASRRGGRAGRVLAAWWPYAVLVLAFLAEQYWYFGDLLPNTYYAKSGGGLLALAPGLLYDFRFLRAWGAVGLLLAVVPLVLSTRRRQEATYVALCTVAYLAHVAKLREGTTKAGRAISCRSCHGSPRSPLPGPVSHGMPRGLCRGHGGSPPQRSFSAWRSASWRARRRGRSATGQSGWRGRGGSSIAMSWTVSTSS